MGTLAVRLPTSLNQSMPTYQRPDLNAVAGLLARLQQPKPCLELSNLACGIEKLLDHAIGQHRQQYQGWSPQRIELHPALGPPLYHALHPLLGDAPMYKGVLVVFTELATLPRLITWCNEVEYL